LETVERRIPRPANGKEPTMRKAISRFGMMAALSLAVASEALAGWNVYLVRDSFGKDLSTKNWEAFDASYSTATGEEVPDTEAAGLAVIAEMPEKFRLSQVPYHYCLNRLIDGVEVYLYRRMTDYASTTELIQKEVGIDAIAINGQDLDWLTEKLFGTKVVRDARRLARSKEFGVYSNWIVCTLADKLDREESDAVAALAVEHLVDHMAAGGGKDLGYQTYVEFHGAAWAMDSDTPWDHTDASEARTLADRAIEILKAARKAGGDVSRVRTRSFEAEEATLEAAPRGEVAVLGM
jgi:hypothetical protein